MSSAQSWLLRNVEIDGTLRDCLIRDGTVAAIRRPTQPRLAQDNPPAAEVRGDEQVLDAGGGVLLPGLADHHVHLLAAAAAANSVDLAGSANLDEAADGAPNATDDDGWLRVIGAGAELTRSDVDRRWPNRPVRVQHRSGALWTFNSAAVQLLQGQLAPHECSSGQLWRADDRVAAMTAGGGPADVTAVGRSLACWGVTHLLDATPELDAASIGSLSQCLDQRLWSMSAAGAGPRKIVIADNDLPDLDDLTARTRACHEQGRPVGIHSVTAVSMALSIAALTDAGVIAGDRIEHAAVCDDSAADQLAELGVTVVTQPSIFARHGTRFIAESPAEERRILWRYRGLLDRGVAVAISSDAPYGNLNPWVSVANATTRPDAERVPASAALTSLLSHPLAAGGPARRVAVGTPADLCLLTAPLGTVLAGLERAEQPAVAATFLAGTLVHRAAGNGRMGHRDV